MSQAAPKNHSPRDRPDKDCRHKGNRASLCCHPRNSQGCFAPRAPEVPPGEAPAEQSPMGSLKGTCGLEMTSGLRHVHSRSPGLARIP